MIDKQEIVRVFLALGSNLGEREEHLARARALLSPQVRLTEKSAIYETEPWGFEEQPDFLNQVLEARTRLSPDALLSFLKRIEKAVGRRESFRYGPRAIDIDILFYGDEIFAGEDLQIPHPRIEERAFVLVPMAEIAPQFIHPVRKETIAELLSPLDQKGIERYTI